MGSADEEKYHWNAADYERHSSSQQLWAQAVVGRLCLQGDERILDVGCGDGKVTAELAARVPRGCVLGIDNSEEMIAFAQAKFPARRVPNLSFNIGDATQLDFGGDFDLIVSFSCLHWVTDHAAVLNGIRKSLRPGGSTVLQFGGKGNAVSVFDATGDVLARPQWGQYFEDFSHPWTFYGPDEYDVLLRKAGLVTHRVELVLKVMVHESVEGFEGWMRTTWLPYVERLPEDLGDTFVADVIQRHIQKNPLDAEGHIRVQMTRLEVEATV